MSRRDKIILWITGVIGILLVLLVALILLLPRLINLEPVREKILANISRTVGGQVELQRVDLSFFPRPRVVVHKASLSISGKIAGTLESATIYPEILPLFSGRVRIAVLRIEAPEVKMKLSQRPEKKGERPKALSLATIDEKVDPLLALLASRAPGLVVLVEKGRLDLSEENEPVFRFEDIEARISLPPDRLGIVLTCKSNLWESMSLKGSLNPKDLTATGRIDLTHFQPQGLPDHLFPFATPRVGDSQVNLNLSFQTDRLKALQAEVQGSIPYLTLHQADEKLVIKGKSLKGALDLGEGRATVSLTGLDLEYPRLNLSGKLLVDLPSPRVSLELEGRDVDVPSTREVVLALAGEIPTIQEIFGMVKAGQVPLITVDAQGSSMGDLVKTENILIKGSMVEGNIFISGASLGLGSVNFDLQGVKGDVIISQGILEGENLEARWENTQVREGRLRLGLEGEDAPLHLDTVIQADLVQLPGVLKGLVKSRSFRKEIALIKTIKGSATGRLVLGESTGSIKARVDVSQFNLSAHYRRLPYLLKIQRGQVSYDGDRVGVKNLRGTLGKTSFSGLTARLGFKKVPSLETLSGKSSILLDQVYPWLLSFDGLKVALKDLKSVRGTIALSILDLKGPLLRPQKWRFRMRGEVENLAVVSALLPGRAAVTGAKFQATPKKISLTDARARLLDASLRVSGVLNGYQEGLHNLDFTFQGNLGPKATQWVTNLTRLPPSLRVRPPLSISKAHLGWNRKGKTSFSGNLAVKDGPKVSIDLLVNPDELMIKNLLIQDEASHAAFALNLKKRQFHLGFKGHLDKTTLDGLLVKNQILAGRIDGDIQTHILLDDPMRSTAHGKLQAVGLGHPFRLKVPVTIENASLVATENRFNVESALLTWGDRHLSLEGDLDLSGEEFLIDMNLSADGIEWDQIEQILDRGNQESHPEEAKTWALPLRGHLRVKSKYFTYEKFTWRPFHADISFGHDEVGVTVTEADLCGISTPGVVKVTPHDLSLEFKPVSTRQELEPTLNCLLSEQARVTGSLDFKAEIMARAKPEELARSLQGNFEMVATDGRIHQEIRFEKILAFLNLTEIFVGKLPDMREEGFPYNSIKVRANLKNGRLMIEEAIMDSPLMKMAFHGEIDLIDQKTDLMVLVAPLRTVDRIIKYIPLVRQILGGTLISIPIKVKGDLTAPRVEALSPSAVGSEVLGMMTRTLQLPVKIIEPVLPEKEKK